MKKLHFRNGDAIHAIGLGTWKSDPGEVGRAIETALEAGYRHPDCATIYGNEPEVGEALQRAFSRGEIRREDEPILPESTRWTATTNTSAAIPSAPQAA